MTRVVVIGASVGGVTVAQSLRELGFDGEIVLLEAGVGLPYQRPPLSKAVLLGQDPGTADLIDGPGLMAIGVEFRPGARALGLDLARRRLRLPGEELGFDELVIACGASATVPTHLEHLVAGGAHLLRTREDAVGLSDALEQSRRLIVLGGGVLGSEIASAATARGVPTTLLSRTEQGVGPLRGALSAPLLPLHRAHGVDVRTEVSDVGRVAGGWSAQAREGEVCADTLVLAVGVHATADWLADSLPVGPDGIRCDASGRVAPGVWAIGDAADRAGGRHEVSRRTQAAAVAEASTVAAALVGLPTRPAALPYFWSDIHGVRVQAAGRISPRAVIEVVERSVTGDPVAFVAAEEGVVAGAAAWGSPRAFRSARSLLGTSGVLEEIAR
ncbi:NAD(P)/FAD-dependent oxidoreductase [Pseudactinotalea sp.]|uniref:NAD(P)/FAD-dependent oxidoreductase n=1 Tax=Pseudactinotalea sp. TaxID=1926260 RepID=UPI003B3AEC5F